ncbi:MAG: hypothetical protein EXS08_08255 [Planctomycetes bacterium]|nr:hypothetical protein [Planctomycetota bacterium]
MRAHVLGAAHAAGTKLAAGASATMLGLLLTAALVGVGWFALSGGGSERTPVEAARTGESAPTTSAEQEREAPPASGQRTPLASAFVRAEPVAPVPDVRLELH